MRTARQGVILLAAILACALLVLAGGVEGFRQQQSTAIFTQQQIPQADSGVAFVNSIRGGAVDDSDDEETDDEEGEEEAIVKSAKKATKKAVKKEIKTAIAKPSKKSGFFKLPYILKACLNPIIFWQMTTGYWKSLFNIDYMAENVSVLRVWICLRFSLLA